MCVQTIKYIYVVCPKRKVDWQHEVTIFLAPVGTPTRGTRISIEALVRHISQMTLSEFVIPEAATPKQIVADVQNEPPKEARPGIGYTYNCAEKIMTLAQKRTLNAEPNKPFTVKILFGLDFSASMNRNGGKEGLVRMLNELQEFSDMLKQSPNRDITFEVAFFEFATTASWPTCTGFSKGLPNVPDFVPLKNCKDMTQMLSPLVLCNGHFTDIESAVKFGATSLASSIGEDEKDTTGVLVITTDGCVTHGSPNAVRIAQDAKNLTKGLPISFHTIALGHRDTDPQFLLRLTGTTGFFGLAKSPGDCPEAFLQVFGAVNNCYGTIGHTVSLTRNDRLVHKAKEHAGLLVAANRTGVVILRGVQPGDMIRFETEEQSCEIFVESHNMRFKKSIVDEATVLETVAQREYAIKNNSSLTQEETIQASAELNVFVSLNAPRSVARRHSKKTDVVLRSLAIVDPELCVSSSPPGYRSVGPLTRGGDSSYRSLCAPFSAPPLPASSFAHTFANVSSQCDFQENEEDPDYENEQEDLHEAKKQKSDDEETNGEETNGEDSKLV